MGAKRPNCNRKPSPDVVVQKLATATNAATAKIGLVGPAAKADATVLGNRALLLHALRDCCCGSRNYGNRNDATCYYLHDGVPWPPTLVPSVAKKCDRHHKRALWYLFTWPDAAFSLMHITICRNSTSVNCNRKLANPAGRDSLSTPATRTAFARLPQ